MSDWSFYDRGFSLFPLRLNSKIPSIPSWEPFIHERATPEQIAEWRQFRGNTGVATGKVSGVVVFDCDSLIARIRADEMGLPSTFTVATPRGAHFYFRHPGWKVSNHAGRKWTIPIDGEGVDGWDLKADGGYVVGPGSYYQPTPNELASGKRAGSYIVENDAPIADAPEWLLKLMAPVEIKVPAPFKVAEVTSAWGRKALHEEIQKMIDTPSGSRNDKVNDMAFRIAQIVAGGEVLQDEAWGGLQEALCALSIDHEGHTQTTLLSGWTAGLLNPRSSEPRVPLTTEQALGVRQCAAIGSGVPAAPPPPYVMPSFTRSLVPVKMVLGSDLTDYFKGCVYLANLDKMFVPSGVMVGKSAFDGMYGGPAFALVEGKAPTRSAWEMFRTNEHVNMPMAWDICFRPELPPGQMVTIDGLPFLNTYVPINTPRAEGDASRFVEHVHRLLPNGRDAELLLHWMASAVQNPGVKFQWWPVVQGTKGNGKSLLLRVMYQAIGERYSHQVRADSVIKTGNQFNEWIVGKLFLGFEEIRSSEGKRDFVEVMKDSVTAERLATEGKGRGQTTSDNRANGLMCSNWLDSCPIDDDERRWGIFFCAQQSEEDMQRDGLTGEYFEKIYEWLKNEGGYAIVTNYLATRPLEYALDPARGLQRAPETSSTQDAISESLGVVEQEIMEEIEGEVPGFRDGIILSTALKTLFDRLRKNIGRRKYRAIMQTLGYVTHPALLGNNGRPNNALSNGTRPVIYFRKDHEILATKDIGEILASVENNLRGEISEKTNVILFKR